MQHLEFLTSIDSVEVSNYKSGKRNLTLKTLIKFANALQVNLKELFNFGFDIENYRVELYKYKKSEDTTILALYEVELIFLISNSSFEI